MEIAAAALQFTTIAAESFRGCLLAIEIFSTAQHMGADGDFFRTGLEFEKYRLLAWADRVGLLGESERQTLNWPLAGMILEQLRSTLTSANILRDRYSLNISEEEIQVKEEAQTAEGPKSGIAGLVASLKPTLYTTAGRIIQENNSTLKRLRWAARDKKKLKEFIAAITGLINKLEILLDSTERQQERDDYERLIREVISHATTTAAAGDVKELLESDTHGHNNEKAIKAAAYLKQVRLVLGADKQEAEVTPTLAKDLAGLKMPKLAVLKRSLKPWNDTLLFSNNLEFATYREQQVLIQWKSDEGVQWDRQMKQMKCLAVFLMALSDKSFRSLRCLGYYPIESQGRHGIVYSMPDEKIDWEFKTLKDLLATQSLVSLNRRIEISKAIADTVLQLHTAGWLHKGLRSENIIFLAQRGSSDDVFLQSEPYVFGYEYARSDTEDSAKAFTQLPDTELKADLYRHPQARGLGRETFQKRFDLYALACILVELVAWKPLINIFSSHINKELENAIAIAQESNEVMELPSLATLFEKEGVVDLLKHQAGERTIDAIKVCFSAKEEEKDKKGMLTAQTAVVEKLAWCKL